MPNNSRLFKKLGTENETQPTIKSPTNTTPNNASHPAIDPTIDDPATLTPDEINNQATPDKNDFSDDSIDQSPAVTSKHPLKTTFKRLPEATDSEGQLKNTTLTKEQRNIAIHVCRAPHHYSFRTSTNYKIQIRTKKKNHLQGHVI